jgi:2-oxo-3-hexenedioate decarboxylase
MTTPHELAGELLAARARRGLVAPPSERMAPFSLADGYGVARLLHEQKLTTGATQVGVKLGFTNQALWPAFGLDQPFWSPIYDDTVTAERTVSIGDLVAPMIEPEIVVGTKADLHAVATADEVCAALDWAAPGFEIVHSHYPDWVMTPADAVADAGLHGCLVVGERVALSPDTAPALAGAAVQLERHGEIVATGSGSDALGGPVEAVRWLVRLPGVDVLPAGSVVTTGTLTAPFAVCSGERWRSTITSAVVFTPLEIMLRP